MGLCEGRCEALGELCNYYKAEVLIREKGGLKMVLEAMRSHADDNDVQVLLHSLFLYFSPPPLLLSASPSPLLPSSPSILLSSSGRMSDLKFFVAVFLSQYAGPLYLTRGSFTGTTESRQRPSDSDVPVKEGAKRGGHLRPEEATRSRGRSWAPTWAPTRSLLGTVALGSEARRRRLGGQAANPSLLYRRRQGTLALCWRQASLLNTRSAGHTLSLQLSAWM